MYPSRDAGVSGGSRRHDANDLSSLSDAGGSLSHVVGYPFGCVGVHGDADPDFMTATIVIHEFLHPFGIDPEMNMDHYASTVGVKRGGVTVAQQAVVITDLYESQYYHSICPDVFPRFKR